MSYLDLESPIRFAHRGSSLLWPENTSVAFQGAADLGYRYFETDVQVSRDGVVIVFHDATLDRTTDGIGPVAEWDWADLRRLDAAYRFGPEEGYPHRGTGVRIWTLSELLANYPDVNVNIDLKAAGGESVLAETILRSGRKDSVLVGSFYGGRVRRFRRMAPQVATAATPGEAARMWLSSRAGRSAGFAVAYQMPDRPGVIDRRFVDACHDVGAHVHVWTVNEIDAMKRLLDLGVDGIVTDRPDLLNDVLDGWATA